MNVGHRVLQCVVIYWPVTKKDAHLGMRARVSPEVFPHSEKKMPAVITEKKSAIKRRKGC